MATPTAVDDQELVGFRPKRNDVMKFGMLASFVHLGCACEFMKVFQTSRMVVKSVAWGFFEVGLTKKLPSNLMSLSSLGYFVGSVTETGMTGKNGVNLFCSLSSVDVIVSTSRFEVSLVL